MTVTIKGMEYDDLVLRAQILQTSLQGVYRFDMKKLKGTLMDLANFSQKVMENDDYGLKTLENFAFE